MSPNRVVLWIGGAPFATSRDTLLAKRSFFSGLLQTCSPSVAEAAEFFIDRDPVHFRYIINYLRGCVVLPTEWSALRELRNEAEFYCLDDLVHAIDAELHCHPGSFETQLQNIASAILALRR